MNYYIADLHLGHENVIRFDNRPFENTTEMNQRILENWNDRVTKDDIGLKISRNLNRMLSIITISHTERDLGKVAEIRFCIERLNCIGIDYLLRRFEFICFGRNWLGRFSFFLLRFGNRIMVQSE